LLADCTNRIGPRGADRDRLYAVADQPPGSFSQIQGDTPISWLLFLFAIRGAALGLTVQTTFATALLGGCRARCLPPWLGARLLNSTRFCGAIDRAWRCWRRCWRVGFRRTTKDFAQQAQEQEITSTNPAPFGLCETPGVPADQNVPAGVPDAARPQALQSIQQACTEYLFGF